MPYALSVLIVAVLFAMPAWGTTISVYPDGSGEYPTIQEAIDNAQPGDIISLHNGEFTGELNRDLHTDGKPLTIRSFSGNADSCVINVEGTDVENHRGFNFGSGDNDVVLENFTITGGYVTGSYPEGYGGGILDMGSDATINNVTFTSNYAEVSGGGVYINSNASFNNCFFDSCTATTGGAAGIAGSNPAFTECHFTNNVGTNNAGAVFTVVCSPTFENCEFLNNNTYNGSGGGVFCGQDSEVTLNTCTFNYNSALQLGGGVHCVLGGDAIMTECDFAGNYVTNPNGNGGGLSCGTDSYCTANGCMFQDNNALSSGGGIYLDSPGNVIYDCLLLNNEANNGGGIYIADDGTADIDSCYFSDNTVTNDGGAIYAGGNGYLVTTQCTFEQNVALQYGGAVYYDGPSGTFVGCTFTLNSASTGGAFIAWEAVLEMSGCEFTDNHADIGYMNTGGVNLYRCTATIEECTFIGNTAEDTGAITAYQCGYPGDVILNYCTIVENTSINPGWGGGVMAMDGGITINSCTIAGNNGAGVSAGDTMGAAFINNSIIAFNDGESVDCGMPGSIQVSCSDVYGNTGGDYVNCISGMEGVDGNISLDPLFCTDEYTLRSDSPCAPFSPPNNECDLIGALGVGCEPPSSVQGEMVVNQLMLTASPNPFGGSTTIQYALPEAAQVQLSIYDVTGRQVEMLVREKQDTGVHNIKWTTTTAAGIYFARLDTGTKVITKTVVVTR